MSRLRLAIDQIVFARNYTLGLLDQISADDWFRMPPGSVSHIGWQVGHIAYAQFRLAVWRIRGPQPGDEELFPADFKTLFGPDSSPVADTTRYPSPTELRAILDRINELVLRALPGLSEADLDEPVPHPHPFAKTKLLALLWCANHEMLHAGQIGLLRRQLGFAPLW